MYGEENVNGDQIKTPILPKTWEEWGTRKTWNREPKQK
jgi:hypothetical protein